MSIDPHDRPASMSCGEMARSLEPFLDGEFEGREEAELSRHLSECEPCRTLVEREARARSRLRAKLREAMGPGSPAGTAPAGLQERISAALDREARPARRWAPWPVSLGAVAAAAAGVMVVLATQGGADPLIDEAVRKHARDLPLEVNAASVAPETIPGLLASKLDFNPRPPAFRAQGMKLMGARLSQLRDRPAAYMRYELPRGQVGLYIIDDPEQRIGGGGRQVQVGPSTVRMVNARGYNIAVWRRNEIVYSLVSDLDEADLVRLVETAQAAADR